MKRIAICILMVTCMLTAMMNVPVSAAQMSVWVTASNENVQVGDTVEFTVLATGQDMVALQFEVRLPEGLAYIPNSGATPEGLAQKLGIPAAEWTEQSMMFTCYNDVGVTVPEGTQLLSFSCVAQKSGQWTVELFELIPFDSDFQAFSAELQVETIHVTDGEGGHKPGEPGTTGATVPAATTPTEPETPVVTDPADQVTQPASEPDQTMDQLENESVPNTTGTAQQPDEPEEQPQEVQEPVSQKTLFWIILSGGVLLAAGIAAAVLLGKKKAL